MHNVHCTLGCNLGKDTCEVWWEARCWRSFHIEPNTLPHLPHLGRREEAREKVQKFQEEVREEVQREG